MAQKPFIPVLRELARAFQAFEAYSAGHVRTLGLTPSQFDIVATLGNTAGLSCRELGERTLITKGTLTGVIDRLEDKNLVRRTASSSDGRCQIVQLTRKGEVLFERVFAPHLDYIGRAFAPFPREEMDAMHAMLQRLRLAIEAAAENRVRKQAFDTATTKGRP